MAFGDVFANRNGPDSVLNFFYQSSPNARSAQLAAPFFTTCEPIELLTQNDCEVLLLVRLCNITLPKTLKQALGNPKVKIRYYTDQKFHTKLYIIDDMALVGSANLTDSGLKANRELSVVIRQDRDAAFQELPSIFDVLWDHADVLTEEILKEYEKAHSSLHKPVDEDGFEKFLKNYVVEASPPSVVVGSNQVSKERTFMQNFRRKYDETLIPYHDEILRTALKNKFGRQEYFGHDPKIEMDCFLGWLRLTQGSGDGWRETTIVTGMERQERIAHYVSIWQSTDDTVKGDMYEAKNEIVNIHNIQTYLCDPSELGELDFDTVFDFLCGCHAFLELLRYVPKSEDKTLGGRDRHRIQFKKQNKLENVKDTINYLLSGTGDPLVRAYDCIYSEKYKLNGFGEACVMELLGWGSPDRPPFNNRSIRGIRLLGYDVEHLVAGG